MVRPTEVYVSQMYLAHQVQVQMQEVYTAMGIDISEPTLEVELQADLDNVREQYQDLPVA